MYDGFLKIFAGANVAAGNPAIVAARLQGLANRFRDLPILGRIADKDRRTHDRDPTRQADQAIGHSQDDTLARMSVPSCWGPSSPSLLGYFPLVTSDMGHKRTRCCSLRMSALGHWGTNHRRPKSTNVGYTPNNGHSAVIHGSIRLTVYESTSQLKSIFPNQKKSRLTPKDSAPDIDPRYGFTRLRRKGQFGRTV